jgi:hypothetical protein
MSSIRDQYAKMVIQTYHEKLSKPHGPWKDGLPKPREPVYRAPGDEPVTVGIIGAGAAGLYAALIIDSLADSRIAYEIFDANPMKDRKGGGRLYTYDFKDGEVNDYFVSLFVLGSSPINSNLFIFLFPVNLGCWRDAVSRYPVHETRL